MPAGQRIAVVGTGYVGLVSGACLAAAGHHVTCHDIDAGRIQALEGGRVPFHEPGLPDVVAQARAAGRLRFTTSLGEAVGDTRFVLVAVGTPAGAEGTADLRALSAAFRALAGVALQGCTVVLRSTVPPGTGDRLQADLAAAGRPDLRVVNAPEFLAEGTAVHDFTFPERLVFGGPRADAQRVAGLWDGVAPGAPRFFTERSEAELAKYAANAFLAARVSLVNEMANLCDRIGADVRVLAGIVGSDSRIGPKFLQPGIGYGGSCFPKDVRALAATARSVGLDTPMLEAIERTNELQWSGVLQRVQDRLGPPGGKTVAIWGIAFKPGTDDVRQAPGLRLARALAEAGAIVQMHDPVARLPSGLATLGVRQVPDPVEACRGAHLLVQVTEWPQYRELDWTAVRAALAEPDVLDARNALPWDAMASAGLRVAGVGARMVAA